MIWIPERSKDFDGLYVDLLRLSELLKGLRLVSYTAADIGNVAAIVNVRDKYESKAIWDSTNSRVLYASGQLAADDWVNALGATAITPS